MSRLSSLAIEKSVGLHQSCCLGFGEVVAEVAGNFFPRGIKGHVNHIQGTRPNEAPSTAAPVRGARPSVPAQQCHETDERRRSCCRPISSLTISREQRPRRRRSRRQANRLWSLLDAAPDNLHRRHACRAPAWPSCPRTLARLAAEFDAPGSSRCQA